MFFALAGVAALFNWIAVERKNKVLEYIAKPATTALLIGAAVALDPHNSAERAWFVVALVLCLVGDVFLMLPQDMFVPGLASFLLGHICFLGGFIASHPKPSVAFIPLALIVALAIPRIAAPVVRGARAQDKALVPPVIAYVTILALLLIVSLATGRALAIAGAFVFVTSDTILANNRFVKPLPHGHLATMVTYHAALALLVLSLR